jgi:hypothetical protein
MRKRRVGNGVIITASNTLKDAYKNGFPIFYIFRYRFKCLKWRCKSGFPMLYENFYIFQKNIRASFLSSDILFIAVFSKTDDSFIRVYSWSVTVWKTHGGFIRVYSWLFTVWKTHGGLSKFTLGYSPFLRLKSRLCEYIC